MCVLITNNPVLSIKVIDNLHFTQKLFEIIVSQINVIRYSFEYKRILMAFTSILSIDYSHLPNILQKNLDFIVNKIVDLSEQLTKIYENKLSKNDNDEVILIFIISLNLIKNNLSRQK